MIIVFRYVEEYVCDSKLHIDILTAEVPLSRVAQLAKQDAAAERRTLYVTPTPASLSASESPC